MTRRGFLRTLIGGGAAGVAVGAAGGAGGMLAAYPYLFPPPPAADAAPADARGRPLPRVATFAFDEASPGRDPIHWANGRGGVFGGQGRFVIRIDESFEAGPGPNFWVYLTARPVARSAEFLADPTRVKLAPLRAFRGAQNFEVPPGLDPLGFAEVVVWCETFSVYIGSAAIVAEASGAPVA